MAYRGVKGSDPFVSKTSRNERFAQMSKQEQIIQQKKMEIQAKMQEQKAKEAVECMKKSSSSTSTTTSSKSAPKEDDEKPTMNVFANDGSFLDQFKKIASKTTGKQEQDKDDKRKDERSYETVRERDRERKRSSEKNRDWDGRRDRRRNDTRWGRSSDRKHSSSSSPSPTRRRSPPSPETRHSYNQSQNGQRPQFNQQFPVQNNNHVSSIPSLMSQPVQMQMTNIPPPNIRNLTPNIPSAHMQRIPVSKNFNNNYANINEHSNNVRMQIAPPHIIRPPPPPPIQSIPPNTNVPPPNMQMSQTMQMPNLASPSNPQQHIIQNPQQCSVPPPACNANLQPPNIPNIPPPNILPPMSQMPPTMMPITASQAIVVTVPNVANVPPPNVITSMIMSPPPPVHTVPSTINSVPPPNLNIPPPNIPPPNVIPNAAPSRGLMSSGYALSNQVPISVGPPNVQIPPPVRPPANLQNSEQQVCLVEAEQLARIVADCGDEIEQEVREKNAQDPKLWFLHQKQSAAYLQYRGLVSKLRAEKPDKDKKNSGAELYCPEEALSDNDEADKSQKSHLILSGDQSKEDNKEERKRRKRSRWGDPDNKVLVAETNVPSSNRSGAILPQPGIAIPGQIGQPAVIIPSPSKRQQIKSKNPMLTKISRNDPALIHYARQTFGTLDLSEEQWKKAEDHYKINLLYQNLLRKREELKRLEAQGKHKYEYDSDEETEGGTWEHKLRSAEMEATQMWAEELTAQAEGKHHIGDFLPPDELKKFMEQYNAVKQGKEPDLSDYKEYKLKEDNIGFQMLQKLGWSEGQGLGSEGSGRIEPINKATNRLDSAGLGSERPDGVSRDDDEFDAYRKRMMLAYRFRPNPLNNPRRPYY
ncbi:hypothetical protein PUN28_012907 [Cardiocondyla obscurior]|uniref:Splicing factor 4 n=2 Tax=Cardiocondyla obscurior TaxID=286306 RepID=A0AAW2F784_9HYME